MIPSYKSFLFGTEIKSILDNRSDVGNSFLKMVRHQLVLKSKSAWWKSEGDVFHGEENAAGREDETCRLRGLQFLRNLALKQQPV